MELMTQMLVPCVLAGTALYGTLRRVDVYGALVRGAGVVAAAVRSSSLWSRSVQTQTNLSQPTV